MESVKFFLASRTVLSALVGLTATGLQFAGFGAVDQGQLTDAVLSVIQGLSFIGAIFFRVKADAKVSLTPPK